MERIRKRRWKRRWKRQFGSQLLTLLTETKGTSMVSVLAAFTILMIVISMLYTATLTSLNMVNRARVNVKESEAVVESFYKDYDPEQEVAEGTIIMQGVNRDGQFSIKGTLKSQEIEVEGDKKKTFFYYG